MSRRKQGPRARNQKMPEVDRFPPREDQGPVAVTGVWLLSSADGREVGVLIEVAGRPGQWASVIREGVECVGGAISHIVEPLGIRAAQARRR